ncbi:KTSC domain-containing protein [Chelativorans sp.]|uniref:KTSC domain-containing protein n=1 Tax=Chelativorans sp. TaxID=2203393 RepID=UPI0028120C27|nr:KTSC domain-containing protein [Chelativorans sp.]
MAVVEKTRFPDSEVVSAIRYFAPRRELEVRFTSGRTYLYHEVPQDEFDGFKWAESAGGYFNEHIRDRYRHTKLK